LAEHTSSTQRESRLLAFWHWLTEPAASISEPERRRQARLLMALLIVLMLLGLLSLILSSLDLYPSPKPVRQMFIGLALAAVMVLALVYGLSRTAHYRLAAALAVSTVLSATCVAAIVSPESPLLLAFLTLGGLMSSLFLSARATAIVFVVTFIGVWWLPVLMPGLPTESMIDALFFILTVGGLVVMAAMLRRRDVEQIERQTYTLAENEERLSAAMQAAQEANVKLRTSNLALEQRNQYLALLAEVAELLEASATPEEAYRTIAHIAPRLFPDTPGALFVYSASRNDLDAMAMWGEPALPPSSRVFRPDECWALRRGRTHVVEDLSTGLPCQHLHSPLPASYLCVPMMAQGEALGVLHLWESETSGPSGEMRQAALRLVETQAHAVAEQIALALANVKLRETLRSQSIRDALTGLFNRRYLEETLEREIQRAARNRTPLGVIMLDIDHFKRFNDTFGHEAGDALLHELGLFFLTRIRGADIACRYGGEEFTLILPEAPLAATRQRAEELREGVKALRVQLRGQPLGPITLSLGVAGFPDHGPNKEVLLRAADAALYHAKQAGRDRVVVSGASPP